MNVSRTEKAMVLGLVAIVLSFATIAPGLNYPQANAQQENAEDPHTAVTGTMEITSETKDDHSHTTYVFTSNELKNKYGYSTMIRVDEHHLQEGESAPPDVRKVEENVRMKIVHESEVDKLDRYQRVKNNGIPMDSYLQWSIVEPVNQDIDTENSIVSPVLALLRFLGILQPAEATHVEAWAHKSAAYSPYDPINIIITDEENVSTDVLGDAGSKLNGNGWSSASGCLYASDLYVLIGGTYKKQTIHHFKYPPFDCDGDHIRLWRINADLAIGAAHSEVKHAEWGDIRHIGGLNTWEDNVFFGHRVTSFESGETSVKNTFDLSSLTCWDTLPNNHLMSNAYTREYWNNARTVFYGSAISGQYATEIQQVQC